MDPTIRDSSTRDQGHPTRLGPYRVLRELGRGGMGSVYLAVRDDDTFKRHVAIKVIRKGMDTEDVLARFEVERQVLTALNHPNIARVLDGGRTDEGTPFFVLEYVEGLPIDRYCDSNRLTTSERLKLFVKVCGAVHHAHQNLIVHRDLKPSNIIVTKEGEPKLLDFGIAKLLNPALAAVSFATGPEIRVMTPEYASPEQAAGEPITTASDVYSLGVLLYELLCGRSPYTFKTRLRDEVLRVVREVDPEPPSTAITKVETYTNESGQRCTRTPEDVAKQRGEPADRLRRDLRGDVDQIVLMAMSKSPKRRYASAMDFAADLQRHLDGFPVIARPVSAAHKAAKFVRRNRGAVAGASAVAVALLLGVAGVAWQAGEARRERAFAIAQGERLARVRAFAGEFLESLQARIDRTEGSLPAREELARASIAILDYLSQEFPDDPELRFITAQAWRRIGDVQGGSTGNLGQTRQALASYSRAIELLEGQVRSSNDEQGSLDLLLARAGTAYAIADLQQRAGLGDRGRAHIDDVLRILDNVPPNLAASTRAKRQRAVALLLRAADHEASGNTARAEADLAASIAIRREILSNSPNDAGALRDLSVALNRLGERFAANNDGPSALRSYREALQLRAALASQPGADQTAKRDAAMSRRYVGYTLVTLGQTAEGLAPSKTSLP